MIGLSALVATWTLGAALHTAPLSLRDDLSPRAEGMTSLRVDGFGADRPRPSPSLLAQPAEPPASPPTEAPAETTGGGGAEACDVDCETAHEDALMARYVTRRRTQLLRTHRAFAIAAWSGMLITEVLGTIQAVNQPTWFGDGACTSDPEAFGCHQSSMITGLHEGFAITTTALYTTAAILAVAAPDPESASVGDGRSERTLRLHKTMAWVHGVGMVLLPLLGVVTAHPQILGISQEAQGDFSRAMRTVHTVIGYSTFAALTFSAWIEL
ncbi:MAG: hypothetical protein IPN17_27495 [Deltaproteobacteria bacterium]|nr:hypothetical protein [Deltaproteobacteria bacterium]